MLSVEEPEDEEDAGDADAGDAGDDAGGGDNGGAGGNDGVAGGAGSAPTPQATQAVTGVDTSCGAQAQESNAIQVSPNETTGSGTLACTLNSNNPACRPEEDEPEEEHEPYLVSEGNRGSPQAAQL